MTDPDISFEGFSIWVLGFEFPDATDYPDANWLVVRAEISRAGASVRVHGPILMTTDFKRFRGQLTSMHQSLAGEAELSGYEPNLKVTLLAEPLGRVSGVIEITPDHLEQFHRFDVGLDQSYLPALIASCDAILEKFPMPPTVQQ